MDNTIKISLGGFSYSLTEVAFTLLKNYLDELSDRLGSSPESKETLENIEERIAELFSEKAGNSSIVDEGIVREVIDQLGSPQDITGEGHNRSTGYSEQPRVTKRLYRNPKESIIGGVCSGMATYFGVDPIIIRLLFILLLFVKGLGLLLYVVFWIATPIARTPKQKLEMEGEPITVENLEKRISKEFKQFENNISNEKGRTIIQKFASFLGQVFYWILRALFILVKAFAYFIGIILIITMFIAFVSIIGTVFFGSYIFSWYTPEPLALNISDALVSLFDIGSGLWITIPIVIITIIPILALLYAGIRILFRFKANDGAIGLTAATIWIAAVVTLAFVMFSQAKEIRFPEKSKTVVNLKNTISPKTKTIYFRTYSTDGLDSILEESHIQWLNYKLVKINDVNKISGEPTIKICKTSNNEPYIEIIRSARGKNRKNALENANKILYQYSLKDSIVTFDPIFLLPQGEKWKNQAVEIKLNLPKGYNLYLDESLLPLLDNNQPWSNEWPSELVGNRWTMTSTGLSDTK